MVKKILSVLLVVVLLFGITCYASAAGTGNTIFYGIVPFDDVSRGLGFRLFDSFAGSAAGQGSNYDVVGRNFTQIVSSDSSHIFVEAYGGSDSDQIRFYGSNFVVPIDRLTLLEFRRDFDAEFNVTADVSFTVEKMVNSSGRWVPQTQSFSFSVIDNGIVDISRDVVARVSSFTTVDYVLFKEFSVILTGGDDDPDTPNYTAVEMNSLSSPLSFDSWILQYNLSSSSDGSGALVPSLVDWLVDAVGAFLDFELFPGMSINGIIQFIVVVGFVFWFITLLI